MIQVLWSNICSLYSPIQLIILIWWAKGEPILIVISNLLLGLIFLLLPQYCTQPRSIFRVLRSKGIWLEFASDDLTAADRIGWSGHCTQCTRTATCRAHTGWIKSNLVISRWSQIAYRLTLRSPHELLHVDVYHNHDGVIEQVVIEVNLHTRGKLLSYLLGDTLGLARTSASSWPAQSRPLFQYINCV
jgi:hypothetical protein